MNGPDGLIETEGVKALARRVARDPVFQASDRLRRLLLFIADTSDDPEGAGTTQQQIACKILGKGPDFDPAIDPHARIEVGRLRTALKLYFADQPAGALRLEIPKGKYLLCLAASRQSLAAVEPRPGGLRVQFSLSGSGQPDREDALLAAILCRSARSPLLLDGALVLCPATATSAAQACHEARKNACHISAHLHLSPSDPGPSRAWLTLCRTDREALVAGIELPMTVGHSPGQPEDPLVQLVADALADPASGLVPNQAARIWPSSRLALILLAYRFMCTQSSVWAERAMNAFAALEGTGYRSATTLALKADMCRISEVFAIGPESGGCSRALEMAAAAVEWEPDNAAAVLSLGYACLATDQKTAARQAACSIPAAVSLSGIDADVVLLRSLCRLPMRNRDVLDPEKSFFATASEIVSLFDAADWEALAVRTRSSAFRSNFWLPLFDSVASVALGDRPGLDACADEIRCALPNSKVVLPRAVHAMFVADTDRGVFGDALSRMGYQPSI